MSTIDEQVRRFHSLHLGDTLLKRIELRTAEAKCILEFSRGSVLASERASVEEPVAEFAPALLVLNGVVSASFGHRYELNSTVVDFGAVPNNDVMDFYFDLTGGYTQDGFIAKLVFQASGFLFGDSAQLEMSRALE